MNQVTLRGKPIDVEGDFPEKGNLAPSFTLTGPDLKDIGLSEFAGKRKLLNIIPSIDTGVCAASTRKFNEKASNLTDTVVLVISADLPFAAARFCGAEGLENVKTFSSFRHPEFALDYGVAIKSGPMTGLTARAVVVLDDNDKVLHAQLVGEIGDEPDYDAALAVLQ